MSGLRAVTGEPAEAHCKRINELSAHQFHDGGPEATPDLEGACT